MDVKKENRLIRLIVIFNIDTLHSRISGQDSVMIPQSSIFVTERKAKANQLSTLEKLHQASRSPEGIEQRNQGEDT